MLRPVLGTILTLLTGYGAYGQTPAPSPTFDVASVKPAAMPTPDGRGRIMFGPSTGGPGSSDPGRIHYPFSNLRSLLVIAYDVKNYQISGPASLDTERFEITATMPPGTTKEQFHLMLQNLIVDRFKMVLHRETKELPMYTLTVAKGGSKMKESVDAPAPPPQQDAVGAARGGPPGLMMGPPKMDKDGFPMLPPAMAGRPGIFTMMMPGRARLTAQMQTMKDLANVLTNQLAKPVTDATDLKGKYDFVLTYMPEGNGMMGPAGMPPPPPPPPGGGGMATTATGAGAANTIVSDAELAPGLLAAVQSQLGLKLEPKKGPVELLVVDKIEKTPVEN